MKAIFLDDERFPEFLDIEGIPYPENVEWEIIRTVEDAIIYVKENGFPEHVSFDNDLQRKLEGKDFAKFLSSLDMDEGTMPDNFSFTVHSKNIKAAEDIRVLMNNHLSEREKYKKNGVSWPPGPSPYGI